LKGNYAYRKYLTIAACISCLLLLLCVSTTAQAQATKRTRILFLVDASSSMTYNWVGTDNRFAAAATIITAVMDSIYAINNEVEFALRVYGSQYPSQEKNCTDTKLEVGFNLQNASQIKQRMKYITPLGSSPIAFSLLTASNEELSNTDNYEYNFVLITDGGETCDGDICETFSKIVSNKVKVLPYIIGLDSNANLNNYYKCLGKYVSVTKPSEIATAVKLIVDNNRLLLNKPQTLNLTTQYSNSKPLEKATEIFEAQIIQAGYMPTLVRKSLQLILAAPKLPAAKAYRGKIERPAYEFNGATIDNVAAISTMRRTAMANIVLKEKIGKPVRIGAMPSLASELAAQPEYQPINIRSMPVFLGAKPKYALSPVKVTTRKPLAIAKLGIPQELIVEPEMPTVNVAALNRTLKVVKLPLGPKAIIAKTKPLARLSFPAEMKAEPEVPAFVVKPIFPAQYKFGYAYSTNPPTARIYRKRGQLEFLEHLLVKPKAKPLPPGAKPGEPKPRPKEVATLTTQPSDKTEVLVYFTDGKGKYYKTKPMCALVDSKTGNKVHTFMRDILPGGEPEPVVTKAFGQLSLEVYKENGEKVVSTTDIIIEQNKRNIIEVIVGNGTLIIQYISASNAARRTMEYNAVVRRQFSGKTEKDVYMKCSEIREFEPGDYHIEVDVFPPSIHTTDISFGSATVIEIPQPGKVVFTNQQNLGPVQILYQQADQFTYLTTVNVSGTNPEGEQLKLQPGLYKASFRPVGASRNSAPIIVNFAIKANRHTKVELQNYGNKIVDPDLTGTPVYDATSAPTNQAIKIISSGK
jgi:hypothetical protein